MANQFKGFYEFGDFQLDPTERQLRRDGRTLPLTPKAFDVLLMLVENGGHMLRKEEFLEKVWSEQFVEEKNLADNISVLRKLLGDDPRNPTFIETVPRLGYRFVADVREVHENGADVLVAESVRARVLIEEEDDSSPGLTEGVTPASALPALSGKKRHTFTILVAGCAALAVALAIYYFAHRRTMRPIQPQQFKSLAVLPFKSLGPTTEEDNYLGLGMADALITKLSNLHHIVVRPTSAVLRYQNAPPDLVAIGREQQVDALLDGKVQRAGERVRVTVQLVRASDGAPLWADTFDEKFTDIFAVQDAISARAVEALSVRLSGEERSLLAKRYTESAEAYQLYLRGRYHWNRRTADGINKAVEYFSQAIRSDPAYALAYAGLADSYSLLPEYADAPFHESMAQAKAASLKALDIDNTLAEAHVSLAYVKHSEWDWAGVEDEYRRGLALNPNYATGHQWYSEYLVFTGRLDEAMEEIKLAQRLDPLSLIINNRVGMTSYYMRQYDEAIEQLRKTLEFDPDFILTHIFLHASFIEKGMYPEAIPHLAKGFFHDYSPEEKTRIEAVLTSAYEASGEKGLWEKLRDILKSAKKRDYNYPYSMAETYMRLGDKDEAFLWLQKAADVRHPGVATLKVEPAMDGLRTDPRYAELLRRMNL